MPKRILFVFSFTISFYFSFTQDNITDIKNTAIRFVDSLSPLQKKGAMFAFSDTARVKWNNLPVGLRARAGISMGSLSDQQRRLVHRILAASLSSQGYLKSTSIMHLDNLLNMYYDSLYVHKEFGDDIYKMIQDLKWSHKNYFIAFFGDPKKDTDWGFKLEGHHLSLNFTITGNKLSVTPFFIGTDPAEYPTTEYAGWRVLAFEEDFGLKLVKSLSATQKSKAIVSEKVPGDIITAAESGKRLVDYWGIKANALSKQQQDVIAKIIREFVYNFEYDKAAAEYTKIAKAGIQNVYFGWIGELDEEKPHYYILNGPTFLIEFDNNGGPRGSANHIHAIWREKGNEYGEDVLKKHYQREH